MISTPASILRRFARSRALPPTDAVFVARVRERIEPALAAAGFSFWSSGHLAEGRGGGTVVRYRADAAMFVRRFPATAGLLRNEGEPLEFWIAREADSGTVRSELESYEPAALLAAVRAGPGAPPRRRQVAGTAPTSSEEAVDRVAELMTRFLDVVEAG